MPKFKPTTPRERFEAIGSDILQKDPKEQLLFYPHPDFFTPKQRPKPGDWLYTRKTSGS